MPLPLMTHLLMSHACEREGEFFLVCVVGLKHRRASVPNKEFYQTDTLSIISSKFTNQPKKT